MERLSPGRRCSSESESESESESPSRSQSRSNSSPTKSRWTCRRTPSPRPLDSSQPFTARSPPAPDSKSEEEPAGTNWPSPILDDKVLFMFLRYFTSSPFGHCLVRVSLSDLTSRAANSDCDLATTIKPVLQFPLKEFPILMRCVELDSKLYFLGGEMPPSLCNVPNPKYSEWFPPEVYVVDTDTLAAAAAAGNTITDPHQVLKIGPPMNSGKPDPYVFQACGKIYVMGGNELLPCFWDHGDYAGEESTELLDTFEVYEPKKGWSVLPDPIDHPLAGHAVVDREVIVVTESAEIFFFNVDTHAWKKLSETFSSQFRFDTKAEFVDGVLYSCCCDYSIPVAYCKGDDEAKGPFDHLALMSDETLRAYGSKYVFHSSNCLVHLGDRTFCHVVAGISTLPCDKPGVTRYQSLGIFLAFLEMGKIYKEANAHKLPAKVLQTTRLVTPNNIGEEPQLRDCFTVSSRGTVAVQ